LDNFFIAYRDPLFGVIILCAIVFVISFANYWWGVFKNKEEKQSIEKFVKKFEIVTDENEYKKLLEDASIPLESLALLAHAYSKGGDYEKAINIYLVTLKRVKGKDEKQYLLSTLGKTYFKAGFLRRSSEVFLESLRLHPRNEESLKYLSVAYEQLQEYVKAEEVLDSLEELGANVALQRTYLKALGLLKDKNLKENDKIERVLALCEQAPFLRRKLFEHMQENGIAIEKRFFETLPFEEMVDLLWYVDPMVYDITTSSEPLVRYVAMARGLVPYAPQDADVPFALDIMMRLRTLEFTKATVGFEYVCRECKQIFPIHFYRCPQCHSVHTASIQSKLIQTENEENISFL
jgi:lipopolysaccharide biosynthesis regulator YciM